MYVCVCVCVCIYSYIFTYSQWWAVESDQFCWGTRAEVTVLKSQNSRSIHQLMHPTT